jgi:hypothetical protein
MSNILQEYLVKLGFESDEPSYRKLQTLMASAESAVTSHSGGMLKRVLEFQAGVVGAFTGVSAAILGVADKAAMADQGYRLMGLRMLMTADQARLLDMTTKSLGVSLEEMLWDPESRARAKEMALHINKMSEGLGPHFKENMKGIRDFRTELGEFEHVALPFLGMGFASKLFEKLFPDQNALEKIKGWMGDLEDRIPEISDKLATYAVPVLRDTWEILKKVGELVKEGATAFTNLIGILSGDDSIRDSKFHFDNLAKALGHVADFLKAIVVDLIDAERIIVKITGLGASKGKSRPEATPEKSEAESIKDAIRSGETYVPKFVTDGVATAGEQEQGAARQAVTGNGIHPPQSRPAAQESESESDGSDPVHPGSLVALGVLGLTGLGAAKMGWGILKGIGRLAGIGGGSGAAAGASAPAAAAGAEAGGAAAVETAGGLTLGMVAAATAAGLGVGTAIAKSQKENLDRRNRTEGPSWLAEHSDLWRGFQVWTHRHIFNENIPPQPGEAGYTGPGPAASLPTSNAAPASQPPDVKVTIPNTKDNLAYVTNNPGNLRYAGQAEATEYKGFAKFETPEAGYQALLKQIDIRTRQGETLGEYIRQYAPAADHNNTSAYLKNAMDALGTSETVKLSDLDREVLAKFQIKQESGSSVAPAVQQAAAAPAPAREAVIQQAARVPSPQPASPAAAPAPAREAVTHPKRYQLYVPQYRGPEDLAAPEGNDRATAAPPRWIATAPAWYGMRPQWLDHEPDWWAKPTVPVSMTSAVPAGDDGGHLASPNERRAVPDPIWYAKSPAWLEYAPAWWSKVIAPAAANVAGISRQAAPEINWAPMLADMQRPFVPAAAISNSTRTFTVDVGGIFITHPGADEHTISRAVESGVKSALDEQTRSDLAQLAPVWG